MRHIENLPQQNQVSHAKKRALSDTGSLAFNSSPRPQFVLIIFRCIPALWRFASEQQLAERLLVFRLCIVRHCPFSAKENYFSDNRHSFLAETANRPGAVSMILVCMRAGAVES